MLNFSRNKDWAESIPIVMQLGLTMAGSVLFCLFLGQWIDKLANFSGFFTFVFTILGIIGGGNVCYRQIISITCDKNEKD